MARPIAILVAAALLLAAIVAGVLSAGGQVVRGDPETATVVGQYAEIHVGWVYVNADGRIVYHPDSARTSYERRLTPEGVDLVRFGTVTASALLTGAPLPAGAWAVAEARPYKPAKYAICYFLDSRGEEDSEIDASEALDRLPTPAQALLRGRERVFEPGMVEVVVRWLTAPAPPVGESRECWEVAADEAPVLFEILADAGWSVFPKDVYPEESSFEEPSPADGSFDLVIDPELVLLHGVIQGWGG